MLRAITSLLLVAIICPNANSQDHGLQIPSKVAVGVTTDGLLPIILTSTPVTNLEITISFTVESNIPGYHWLKITNEVGAKIRLWKTNGVEVPLKDASANAAWGLPLKTTVSNVMKGIAPERRAQLWWASAEPTPSKTYYGYSFLLEPLFGIRLTNDVILDLRPLMYQASRSNLNVQLVEFPPIKITVKPNGDIN